jgi:hypothetical protein
MSKQTFRKNLNSRTTKMKAVLAAEAGVLQTSTVSLSSSQKIDNSTQIVFSIGTQSFYDGKITMEIFPKDTWDTYTQSFMSTNWSNITEIQISEKLYKYFAFFNVDYTLRFAVSNPRIINNGSYNYFKCDVNINVYTNINDGLTKLQEEGWNLASVFFKNGRLTWEVNKFTQETGGTLRVQAILRSNNFTLYLSNGESFNKTSS